MKYREIPSDFFTNNRARLVSELLSGSFAVVHSADIPWRCADGSMRFIQSSDLFYLTGVDQEETILILCPSHPDPAMREILFVRETSERIATWEGHKLSREEASRVSGIANVVWTDEFEPVLRRLARRFSHVYLDFNEMPRAASPVNHSRDDRFRLWCQDRWPSHSYHRLAPLLHLLRVTKAEVETELIRTACEITRRGFERVLTFVEPGVREYEVEAEYLHEFIRHGSRGFAYEPIVASGANNNVLHYLDNDRVCGDGDLLLLDVGAEYANYNADLTRTIPVNGRFTDRQRAVYESVLRIHEVCIRELVVPGKKIRETYQREAARLMEDELIALGLLEKATVMKERDEDVPELERAYRKYFMHGVSHSLGLDVHDVTPTEGVFVENMCVTVEPGIYIPEEGFGIRLENNIIVRSEGNLDLMADIPIQPDDIEDWMARPHSP